MDQNDGASEKKTRERYVRPKWAGSVSRTDKIRSTKNEKYHHLSATVPSECSIFKLICTFNCIISCSHEIFVMISQMVQVSECWQINTTRHPQTYTSKNKPSRYAVAVWVVIKKKRLKWFDHGSQVDGKQQITILRNAVHCIMDGWRKRQR